MHSHLHSFNLATNLPLAQLSCSKRSVLLQTLRPGRVRVFAATMDAVILSNVRRAPPPTSSLALGLTHLTHLPLQEQQQVLLQVSAPHPSFSIPSSRLTRAAADAVRRANLQSRLRRSAYSARVRQVFRASNLIATAVEPCCSTRASACAA